MYLGIKIILASKGRLYHHHQINTYFDEILANLSLNHNPKSNCYIFLMRIKFNKKENTGHLESILGQSKHIEIPSVLNMQLKLCKYCTTCNVQ